MKDYGRGADVLPVWLRHCHLKELSFAEVLYPAGLRMPSHSHEHASLILNMKGVIEVGSRGQSRVTAPSTLVFMPAHEEHTNSVREEGHTLEIILQPSWMDRLSWDSKLVRTALETPFDVQAGLSNQIALRLYRELQRRDDLTPLVLEGLTLELIAQLLRDTAGMDSAPSSTPHWLLQAKDFLHAHFRESPSLNTIAATLGVHPAHLTRSFRQHYRCTIGDYLRRLRVECACHLLSTGDWPLSQIALEAGFADQGHFSRTFKTLTHMTPMQYRNLTGRAGLR
jgi:AraC family transcriptional regulator